jgi:hypothetical protein
MAEIPRSAPPVGSQPLAIQRNPPVKGAVKNPLGGSRLTLDMQFIPY